MKKIIGLILSLSILISGTLAVPAYAVQCETNFLFFRPWYSGLTVDDGGTCVVKTPEADAGIPKFVWTIVLNLVADALVAVGFVATGFIVYGGFTYMTSAGDPGKVAKGKKIISSAVIGLVIAMIATILTNTIITVVTS